MQNFDENKGYGFIKSINYLEKDVFVHKNSFLEQELILKDNM